MLQKPENLNWTISDPYDSLKHPKFYSLHPISSRIISYSNYIHLRSITLILIAIAFHLFNSIPTNPFAKMNSEIMTKKRPVDILTHKNWREWFQLIELYFAGEELDFILHKTEEEYCAVLRLTGQSGTPTSANTPVTDRENVDELGKSLEGLRIGKGKAGSQGGRMNVEKQRLYRKASAKVLYTISICIDLLDEDLISELATVKEKWEQLLAKYSKVRPQANQEDIAKIMVFKLPKDTKIEDA